MRPAPVRLQLHGLSKVTLGDSPNSARNLGSRAHEIVDESVDGLDFRRPLADRIRQRHALPQATILTDRDAQTLDLAGNTIFMGDGLIEGFGNSVFRPRPI